MTKQWVRTACVVAAAAILTGAGMLRAQQFLQDIAALRATLQEQHRLIVRLTNQVAALETEKRELADQMAEIQWGTRVEDSPEKLVNAFIDAYKNRSGTLCRMYLTGSAKDLLPGRPLGTPDRVISRYQLLAPAHPVINKNSFQFIVRVYEADTTAREVGCYELTLTVVLSDYRYLIDGIKQGQYVLLKPGGSAASAGP